jgi:hypothetical protein
MTIVVLANIETRTLGVLSNTVLGIGGVLGAVGVFFLWGGMWRYWIGCDSSFVFARRVWFLALSVGLWYGAILYYVLVYLPQTRRIPSDDKKRKTSD